MRAGLAALAETRYKQCLSVVAEVWWKRGLCCGCCPVKDSLASKRSPKNFHAELVNTSVSILGVCEIRNICLCVCFSILNNVFIVSESWTRTV